MVRRMQSSVSTGVRAGSFWGIKRFKAKIETHHQARPSNTILSRERHRFGFQLQQCKVSTGSADAHFFFGFCYVRTHIHLAYEFDVLFRILFFGFCLSRVNFACIVFCRRIWWVSLVLRVIALNVFLVRSFTFLKQTLWHALVAHVAFLFRPDRFIFAHNFCGALQQLFFVVDATEGRLTIAPGTLVCFVFPFAVLGCLCQNSTSATPTWFLRFDCLLI